MTIGTKIYTFFCGRQVGSDDQGNRYFQSRKTPKGEAGRRWVLYKGYPEPTKIPALWYSWMHRLTDEIPQGKKSMRYAWEKPHKPNLSGSNLAYAPPGHILKGGERYDVESDYQPWQP